MSEKLKLRAETEDDLIVISSSLQDAILKVGEIGYDRTGRNVNLRLSRFRHEAEKTNKRNTGERIQAGLRIDSVLSVKSRNIDRTDPDAYAVLLSIDFLPGSVAADDPSGELRLVFAGGGEICAAVECIDVILADISDVRMTDSLPLHYDQ